MGRKPEGKAEKMFKNFGKKLDDLLVELDEVKEQAKDEYGDRIEELKRNAETLKQGANNFKENHKNAFDEIEESLEKVGQELKDVYKRVFKKEKQN